MIVQTIFLQLLLLLPVSLILIFMPYWTRKTESFGVSIPEDMYTDPNLQQMRKRYVLHMISMSLLLIISMTIISHFFIGTDEIAVLLAVLGMSLLLVIGFIYYLFFHKQMKQFKKKNMSNEDKKQVVVVQTTFFSEKKTVSTAWFLIPFLIIIITIIFTQSNYQLFPNMIPMNVNFSGEATNWIKKSKASVYFVPLIQLYMLVIFMFVNMVIRRAKQQTNPRNPQKSMRQNLLFRRRWSVFLIFIGTLMIALLSFMQYALVFNIASTILGTVFISVTALILLGAIVLSFNTGQGGSRIKTDDIPATNEGDEIGDDDQYWKLGIFYVNKHDPSLFIEKRFGIGWSVNFARPLAWVFLGAIIGFSIVFSLLVK